MPRALLVIFLLLFARPLFADDNPIVWDDQKRALLAEYLEVYCPSGPPSNVNDYIAHAAQLSKDTIAAGIGDIALGFAGQCRPSAWQQPYPNRREIINRYRAYHDQFHPSQPE